LTVLPDGRVLFAGGHDGATARAVFDVLDPVTGSISPLAVTGATARAGHSAFLLPHNNSVLLIDGVTDTGHTATPELFLPWRNQIVPVSAPPVLRSAGMGGPLATDGVLLWAGGWEASGDGWVESTAADLFAAATVRTDRDQYPANQPVAVTGRRWQPLETVSLRLRNESSGGTPIDIDVVADATGLIAATLPPHAYDPGSTYSVTAHGSVSEAQAWFRDEDGAVVEDLLVTVQQALAQIDPANDLPILFTVSFTEEVTDFDAADLVITTTSQGTPVATVTGSGQTYEVAIDGLIGSGLLVLSVDPDFARRDTKPSDNVVEFMDLRPGVSVEQAAGQSDPASASPIVFAVQFGRPVSDFDASDVRFDGSTVGGTLAASVTGGPATYNVAVTGMIGNGTVVVSVPASAAWDASRNYNSPSVSVDNVVTFVDGPPTPVITQAAAQGDPTSDAPILFAVDFGESVTGFEAGDVQFTGSTAGGTLSAFVSGSGASYTVAVGGMLDSGSVVIAVPAGAAFDALNQPSRASIHADNSVTWVDPRPTVTIEQAAGQSDPTHTPAIAFTVQFSESVDGFDAGDVSLSGSTAGGTLTVAVSGSGATYSVVVTGAVSSGTVVASVTAGGAMSAEGFFNAASTSVDNSVSFDARPTVTVEQAVGQADPTTTGPVAFSVIFSDPVTGFDASDVSLEGTTTGGVLEVEVIGSHGLYTVRVNGMVGSGAVVMTVPAGAAANASGLANVASTSSDNHVFFIDLPPVPTIAQAPGQSDPTAMPQVQFTVSFSEIVAGFDAADVDFSGSTVGGTLVASVSGNGAVYTVNVSGMSGPGTIVISTGPGAAMDAAGQGSASSIHADNSVTFQPIGDGGQLIFSLPHRGDVELPGGATLSPGNLGTFDLASSTFATYFDPASGARLPVDPGFVDAVAIRRNGLVYFSVSDPTDIGNGVIAEPADIIAFEPPPGCGCAYVLVRGSDVFQGPAPDIDALGIFAEVGADTYFVFSLAGDETEYAGVGTSRQAIYGMSVYASFVPPLTSLLGYTYLNGSEMGISDPTVNVDGIEVVSWLDGPGSDFKGTLLLSTDGPVAVQGASAGAEDVLMFTRAFDGTVTWSSYFDGSTFGLTRDLTSIDVRQADEVVPLPPSPAVAVEQAAGQADPTVVPSVTFTVLFSEPVIGFDASDVSLAGSTAGGTLAATVTGTGASYTVVVSGMASDGTVVVSVPAGVATIRGLGVRNTASTSADNVVTYNDPRPIPVITQAAGQSDPAEESPITFMVTFTEAVTGFTASDVDLTGSTAPGSLTATVSGSDRGYLVNVTGMAGPGQVVIRIPAGAATDVFGHPSTLSLNVDNAVTWALPGHDGQLVFGVRPHQTDVTLPPDVILSPGNLGTYDFATGGFGLYFDPVSGVRLPVDRGIVDALAIGRHGFLYLSFSVRTHIGNGVFARPEDVILYEPPANGCGCAYIVLRGSDVGLTTADENIDALAVLAEHDGELLLLVSIEGNGAIPIGAGELPVTASDILNVSLTRPAPGSPIIPYIVRHFLASNLGLTTTSENVDGIEVIGESVNPLLPSLLLSTTGPFTVDGASGSDEDVVLFVPDGVGPAASGTFRLFFDGSAVGLTRDITNVAWRLDDAAPSGPPAPVVTVEQAAWQNDPTVLPVIAFTVQFSEDVDGFDSSDISLAGSTVGGSLTATVAGGGASYTVVVTGMIGGGTVVASVPAGVVTSTARGRRNAASTSVDNVVTFDDARPAPVIRQGPGQTDPTDTSPITFTVTFSESVTGFRAGDVDLSASTVTGTLTASVSGSDAVYTVAVTGMVGPGDVVITIPEGAALDAAGQPSTRSINVDNSVGWALAGHDGRLIFSLRPADAFPLPPGDVILEPGNFGTFDFSTGAFGLYLDGTNGVVLPEANGVVDAMAIGRHGDIYLSFSRPTDIGGGVTAAPQDIVKYEPPLTGCGCAFVIVAGSTFGLTRESEDIDAIAIIVEGTGNRVEFLVSTTGDAETTAGAFTNSDLFTLGRLNAQSYYIAPRFRGTDLGLTGPGENVDGIEVLGDAVDVADLYARPLLLSTTGAFEVSGASGRDEDVFLFQPVNALTGTFVPYFDGSAVGLTRNVSNLAWQPR
jgi:hypothetical protein